MENQTIPEPTGVSLKAAFLLLRELRRYPQLPSIEQLALILDDVLSYEWAVRLLRLEAEDHNKYGPHANVYEFNEWAANVLLGPDFREMGLGAIATDPEVFVLPIGPRQPSIYPPPPKETAV